MPPLRHIIAVAYTAVGFALSFVLLAQVIGPDSPWLVLLLMFYFMGLAKVAEPLVVMGMPASLRAVRAWEASGQVYRQLGVQRFGRLLRDTPLRHLNSGVYLSSDAPDLSGLYNRAASAEATHFWAALLWTPYTVYLLLTRRLGMALLFVAVQLLFNVYPILHLRWLRGRLDGLRGRSRHRFVA
ncbi:hypothetical protein [Ideonella sp. YS5]|uniref:glycosyl-4,4'-diaponeurosporenoate acyltransferase CrtO family protein n=1 Tax=Ideonella sp. YS5 TaxID=3453714 RepID=UPI003EED2EBF